MTPRSNAWALLAALAAGCATLRQDAGASVESGASAQSAASGGAGSVEGARSPARPRPPPPVVAPATSLEKPLAFEEGTLWNGLRVIVIPRMGSPVTAVGLMLPGGSALDGPRPGESLLSHSIHFGQGSGTRREDLARLLASSGADFGMGVLADHVRFSIVGVDTQLDQMIEFLAVATIRGTVDEEGLDRRKNAMVDEMWEMKRDPLRRAAEELPELMFGAGHPYGHSPLGLRRTLARIDLQQVKAHLARTLCPNRAVVVVSGPVKLALVRDRVAKSFGGWERCGELRPPEVAAPPRERSEVRIVHDPERKQVVVLAALPVFGPGERIAPSLIAAGAILGGSLSSRLQARLRAAGGYTYGASSQTMLYRGVGLLVVETALDADRAGPAIEALLEVFADLARNPPTPEELARAQHGLLAERAVALRSVEALTGVAMEHLAAGLPIDAVPFPGRDALVSFAADQIRPERVQLVLVGDAHKLTGLVEGQKLGKAHVIP